MLRVVGLLTASLLMLLIPALVSMSAAQAPADTASDAEARALFTQARAAYDGGRFEEATASFRRAYLLSPRFELLYNIGQSELRAGHEARALEAFEAFLRQAPADTPHRSEVDERARMLRSLALTATTREPAVVRPPPGDATHGPTADRASTATDAAPRPTDDGPGPAPWILVGGGAAALITGAVLMLVSVSAAGRVTSATDGTRWADLQSDIDKANTMWGVGIALTGVGLAAAGVGLVWALTGGPSESGEVSARIRLGPTAVAVEGEF